MTIRWALTIFTPNSNSRAREAAAACTLRPDERAQGLPPYWMIYVTVANTDAAVTKAQQLGGKILAPAFDVMDAGRMAVILGSHRRGLLRMAGE
jgi:predicted enzyme related to lactoylglutathione lyase